MSEDPTTSAPPSPSPPAKRDKIGFLAPASIVVLIALTLAGTYYVRLRILEGHMVAAMTLDDTGMVERLANSFPCPVKARNEKGETPLHWAAKMGRVDIARRLLSKGADINAKAYHDFTPLHWATIYPPPKKDMVEFLIAHGADMNAKRDENGITPFFGAVTYRSKEVLVFFISKGVDVNAEVVEGQSPLHHAAIMGWEEGIEILLAAGANIRGKGTQGREALAFAICAGKGTTGLLIAKGADVNARDEAGRTALHWAAFCGLEEMANLAMENGGDPRIEKLWAKAGGRSILRVIPDAIKAEYLQDARETVELLIAKGADLSAKDDNGQTPLMIAVTEKRDDVAEILRKAGAKE